MVKNNWEVTQYSTLINRIMDGGEKRKSRAGNVYSIFGEKLVIDVSEEFPLLRGRKLFYKPVLGEFAAMLRGPKSIADFKEFGCNYWDAWGAGNEGLLNLDYGNAWIDFNGVNQLENLVKTINTNPLDRRLIVSGWRPDRLGDLSLPCCHLLYQFYIREGKYIDMIWYQRSVDTMIGLPSDIILAAAWVGILANETGYAPGKVYMMLGDTHIYENHITGTMDYLRALKKVKFDQELPLKYAIDSKAKLSNFRPEMIEIQNYHPAEAIKFELNV